MDKDISSTLGRLERYLFRVKRAIRKQELTVALSDCAELAEIARRLWFKLEQQIRIHHSGFEGASNQVAKGFKRQR